MIDVLPDMQQQAMGKMDELFRQDDEDSSSAKMGME
jgi:hypothetical protein